LKLSIIVEMEMEIYFTSKQYASSIVKSQNNFFLKKERKKRERREGEWEETKEGGPLTPHCPASATIGRPSPTTAGAAATSATPTPTRHAAAAAGLPRRCWNWNAAVAGIRESRLGGGGADARGGTDGI
jgi:hypothetical protein